MWCFDRLAHPSHFLASSHPPSGCCQASHKKLPFPVRRTSRHHIRTYQNITFLLIENFRLHISIKCKLLCITHTLYVCLMLHPPCQTFVGCVVGRGAELDQGSCPARYSHLGGTQSCTRATLHCWMSCIPDTGWEHSARAQPIHADRHVGTPGARWSK